MNAYFFGDSTNPLFGAYHPARGLVQPKHAVLFCPPIGHEYIRTHWAIRMVTSKLTRAGMPVFRFDYRGIGDSAGNVNEVESLNQWTDDICLAAQELRDESGTENISIVGLRFGATLAAMAADAISARNLILWEPVVSGADFLDGLRTMHATMVDLWVCKTETENSPQFEELLGFRYRRNLFDQIEAIQIDELSPPACQKVVAVSTSIPDDFEWESLADRFAKVKTNEAPEWNDLRLIETAWLPSKSLADVTNVLVQLHQESTTRPRDMNMHSDAAQLV